MVTAVLANKFVEEGHQVSVFLFLAENIPLPIDLMLVSNFISKTTIPKVKKMLLSCEMFWSMIR